MTAALCERPRREFLGASIHAVTLVEAVGLCRDAITRREPIVIGVVNVAKLVNMRRDPLLRESVLGADLVVADGLPVVWASRLLGAPLPERVTGIDLFEALLALGDREGFSVYFLGAAQEVLDTMLRRVGERLPRLRIAGSRNGYFDASETDSVIEEIAAADPDMLFVGISTPKKELFLKASSQALRVPVSHGVGGSFDVLAGLTKRAPRAWQKLGLEWFYRFLQEPRRMGMRYLSTNVRFVGLLAAEWLRRSCHRAPGSKGEGTDPSP